MQGQGDASGKLRELTPDANTDYSEKGFAIAYNNKDFPSSHAYWNTILNLDAYLGERYR